MALFTELANDGRAQEFSETESQTTDLTDVGII